MLHDIEEDIKVFAGLTRLLWLKRNELIHEGVFTHPNKLVQRGVNGVTEFDEAMAREHYEGDTKE